MFLSDADWDALCEACTDPQDLAGCIKCRRATETALGSMTLMDEVLLLAASFFVLPLDE
jgi:hypothetical protein